MVDGEVPQWLKPGGFAVHTDGLKAALFKDQTPLEFP
jgi:hypothetical protein